MYIPFSNGSEYGDWLLNNCEKCIKRYNSNRYHCDIQYALDEAYFTNGRISDDIAMRLGLPNVEVNEFLWRCCEFVSEE